MALGPYVTYVPPNVYTRTLTEASAAGAVAGLRVPVIIGVGQEELDQSNLELIRGSSSNLDQPIYNEDVSDRFVADETNPNNPILGPANGLLTKLRVRNYPIVDGQGFGRVATDVQRVQVTVNGLPVTVGSLQGTNGYVTLQVPAQSGDNVRVTYYFRRTDTAFTDDVSYQVTPTQATLETPANAPFEVVSGTSDTFVFSVDGVEHTVVLPAGSLSAATTKTVLDSALISGLATSVTTDGEGNTHLTLIAAQKLSIGGGNANGILGFSQGNSSNRVAAFRVFQRPMVDGTDGGITTNDTSKVTVLVNGVQAVPVSVDGTNGLVTLPMAPAPGATVTIRYWSNTWQDTFDYLPNTLVTDVLRCGFAPNRSDFIENQDFVVENPTSDVSIVHWGTSVSVKNTSATPGAVPFGDIQALPTLVDDKLYLAETVRYVNTSVVPSIASDKEFTLPAVPTTGNGRDTPLGQTLFNSVSNNRTSLPSNRPDLVEAYAGRNLRDALGRPALKVTEVDSTTRRFKVRDSVPADYTVYATFNYSRIQDNQFVLTNKVSGAVGTGQFEVLSVAQNANVHQVRFGTKSGLSQVVQWPRGVESVPDAFYTGDGTAVSETVRVTFGTAVARNAAFSNAGAAPYSIYAGTSDQFRTTVNATAFVVDLDAAAPAYLVSGHIAVDGADSVVITTGVNDELNLTIDGTEVDVVLTAGTRTITQVVADINDAIDAVDASGDGGIDFTATAPNGLASFQRIGSAGGDHIITIKGATTPASLPAAFDEDLYVAVRQGNAEATLGLATFQRSNATATATNKPATLVGSIAGTFNIVTGVNDTLNIQVDGIDYTVTLTAGATVATSAIVTTINGTPGLSGVASVATGVNAGQLRLTSGTDNPGSRLLIKAGTANETLGFTTNASANQTQVTVQEIVNLLMDESGFVAVGFAYLQEIEGLDYLTIESITTGTASSVSFVAGSNSAFNTTTGLGIVPGTSGDNGEAATNNFVVTSSNPAGSAGTGIPGQTYTDEVTGLRFTVLPSTTGSYTATGYFTLVSSETWNVNPSVPYLSLPGIELIVTDTVGVGVNDTAMVTTFNPSGVEPAIGDSYFISYRYLKQEFGTRLFTTFKSVEANFGALSPENRVTLAANLMFLNGAVIVGIKQVLKAPNSNQAPDQNFVNALSELESPLSGNVRPDVIVPLATSTGVYGATLQHVSKMSGERYASERMAYIGFAAGTIPTTAQAVARGLNSNRMIAVYPDSAVVTLTDAIGQNSQSLIDGSFIAAALAGSAVSPQYDVATPYTRRRLQGLTRLPRIMDPVEANQTAVAGITILEDLDVVKRVRQGFTTDMTNVMTRLPTVTQISDFVQQSSRNTLDVFIGTKFLASRTNDVEISLTAMFKQMVQAEIVSAFQGIQATVDPDDPTVLRVEAYYQPVFPLLYIVITFNLRAKL